MQFQTDHAAAEMVLKILQPRKRVVAQLSADDDTVCGGSEEDADKGLHSQQRQQSYRQRWACGRWKSQPLIC